MDKETKANTKEDKTFAFTNCSSCKILQDKNNKVCFKCGGKLEEVYNYGEQ